MTDAEADGQIQQVENEKESNREDDWQMEWDEERTVTHPARWWFASTACPLIAGTFGPMANAFNVCALVEEWREKIPPQRLPGFGIDVDDPSYIVIVNAISLVFALVANAALLLNMVGRAPFAIAQPIIIIGFMTASFLLFAIIGVASSGVMQLHDLPSHWTQDHNQAFYYACFAAANYFVVAILMTITVWGAVRGKYDKKFYLTVSQRTLMMQTISFMVYLLVGAAIFSRVEGWRFNDAVYWADFTLLTIGIGDRFVPVTHAGRSLVIFYTFGGILAVGLVISSIRTMILEKGGEKLHARTAERRRQRIHKLEDAEKGMGFKLSHLLNLRSDKKMKDTSQLTERERREAEFNAMRNIQARITKSNQYKALTMSCINTAMLWLLGALVFYEVEYQNWSYFDAVYFSYTSLITLGYGDFQPKSNAGKSFFVFWTLLAVPTLTVLISDMGDTVVKFIADATNWLGRLTITPGDAAFFENLRKVINRGTKGMLFKSQQSARESDDRTYEGEQMKGRTGTLYEILDARLTDDEKAAVDAHCATSPESREKQDIHFYQFLLTKEVRSLLADTSASPPKQFSYDEWSYFLKLLGHDEESPAFHTTRYNTLEHGKRDADSGPQVARIVDHEGAPRHWSWLSLRSPLAGRSTEAQWLLARLLKKLESDMHFSGRPGRGIGDVPPPISLSDFRGYSTGREVDGYAHGVGGEEKKRTEATFG